MKKLFCAVIIAALLGSLAGCGGSKTVTSDAAKEQSSSTSPQQTSKDTSSQKSPGKIQIWTLEEPPTNFTDGKGVLTGLAVDLVKDMQKVLNDNTEIQVIPTARLIEESKKTPNVIAFSLGRNAQREQLYHWILQTSVKPWSFYAKADSKIEIKALDDAKKVGKIGVVRNDIRHQFLEQNGFTNLQLVDNPEQNIKMLQEGRVDIILDSGFGIASLLPKLGSEFKMSDYKFLFSPQSSNSYITLSKEGTDAETAQKWLKAAEEIKKNGTFDKTVAKWQKYMKDQYGLNTSTDKTGALVFEAISK